MKTKPTIGIAFGGGGIRGMAHIGVIEELDRHGIRADMVAGTSIGSAIASMYAMGLKGEFLGKVIVQMDMKSIMPIKPSKSGFIDGKNYAEFVGMLTKGSTIESTPIPLRIVATDLVSWERVVFDQGPITTAVQASSAIPGAFLPVSVEDKMLVDGCLLDNCPDDILKAMGADIIIAIDLDCKVFSPPKNLIEVIQRSMDIMSSAGQQIEDADVVIRPFHEYVSSLALDKTEYCLEKGREAAAEHIDKIVQLINDWQPQ